MGTKKIGIVSDSHGDIKTLTSVLDFFKANHVSLVIHLGDDLRDTYIFNGYGFESIVVPGTRDEGYCNPDLRTILKEINLRLISISHLKDNANRKANIILYGHTHKPEFYFSNNVLFVNPGHVINNKKRFPISTFIIMDINDKVTINYYSTNNALIEKKDFLL